MEHVLGHEFTEKRKLKRDVDDGYVGRGISREKPRAENTVRE